VHYGPNCRLHIAQSSSVWVCFCLHWFLHLCVAGLWQSTIHLLAFALWRRRWHTQQKISNFCDRIEDLLNSCILAKFDGNHHKMESDQNDMPYTWYIFSALPPGSDAVQKFYIFTFLTPPIHLKISSRLIQFPRMSSKIVTILSRSLFRLIADKIWRLCNNCLS